MAYLALVRHGKSEWNARGLWTGWTDIGLNEEGRDEARKTAKEIGDISFDMAFTSDLSRAKETLDIIKRVLHLKHLSTIEDKTLRERNYGDFTGKNKWEIKKEVGEDRFKKIRRGWDVPITNGESLKQVYERVIPYYNQEIEPKLKERKNVIISAHGNSLRALIKYLENISDKGVENTEIGTGEVYLYTIGQDGQVKAKEIRSQNPNTEKI